jgi:hypothetical protein
VLGERGEVGLVLDVHRHPEPRLELVRDGLVRPPEVRSEHDGSRAFLDEAWNGDGDPHRTQPVVCDRVERRQGRSGEPVEHGPRCRRAVVAIRPALVPHGTGQVLGRDGDVVDVHLEPDPDHDSGELERDAGTPHAARRRRLAGLPQELQVDELRHQARDRAPREAGLCGDLCPRP